MRLTNDCKFCKNINTTSCLFPGVAEKKGKVEVGINRDCWYPINEKIAELIKIEELLPTHRCHGVVAEDVTERIYSFLVKTVLKTCDMDNLKNLPFPKYIAFKDNEGNHQTNMQHHTQFADGVVQYWKHNGSWGIYAKWVNGKLFTIPGCGQYEGSSLVNQELFELSEDEYEKLL